MAAPLQAPRILAPAAGKDIQSQGHGSSHVAVEIEVATAGHRHTVISIHPGAERGGRSPESLGGQQAVALDCGLQPPPEPRRYISVVPGAPGSACRAQPWNLKRALACPNILSRCCDGSPRGEGGGPAQELPRRGEVRAEAGAPGPGVRAGASVSLLLRQQGPQVEIPTVFCSAKASATAIRRAALGAPATPRGKLLWRLAAEPGAPVRGHLRSRTDWFSDGPKHRHVRTTWGQETRVYLGSSKASSATVLPAAAAHQLQAAPQVPGLCGLARGHGVDEAEDQAGRPASCPRPPGGTGPDSREWGRGPR
ncbi:uncharacterized protein LOC124958425 [Sciurus carolinensis]|uniref:uncharacterized protein LOC124958425 n=1 Tax=Sciurus carolinensis TaxID=30640 RepID=UPI001FB3F3B7|nr:uncharacterized protein LOC124958425 [Sciurus carolinensis]